MLHIYPLLQSGFTLHSDLVAYLQRNQEEMPNEAFKTAPFGRWDGHFVAAP